MTQFGTDILCVDDIRTGRLARGIAVVAQRVYHRLITPRGTLLGHGDFGFDISGELGKRSSPGYEKVIASKVVQEVTKDPVVQSATCRATLSGQAGEKEIHLELHCQTADGPFELVVSVSMAGPRMLRMVVGS